MTEYVSYRHSPALTAEVTEKARTPEARELAARLVLDRCGRSHAYSLDGVCLGSGSGTSDGYIVSGRRGSEMWLVRVHHEGIPAFIAAAHLLDALKG